MQVTLAGLHETFSDAKDIMKWLGTCAKVIASKDEAVQWSTPLGLPVVQPYRQVVSEGVMPGHGHWVWARAGAGQVVGTATSGRGHRRSCGASGGVSRAATGLGSSCQMVNVALLPLHREIAGALHASTGTCWLWLHSNQSLHPSCSRGRWWPLYSNGSSW